MGKLRVSKHIEAYRRYFDKILSENNDKPVIHYQCEWRDMLEKVPDEEGFSLKYSPVRSLWNHFNQNIDGFTFYCEYRDPSICFAVARVKYELY